MSDKLSNKTLLEGLFSLLKTESFQEQPKTAPVEQEDCVADEDWHDFLKSNKSRQGRRELDNPWEHMKKTHRRKYKQRSAHKSLRENMDDMMLELDGLVKESSVKKLSNTAKDSIKGAVTTPEANNNAGDAYFTNSDTDYMEIGDVSYNYSGASIEPGDKVFGVTSSVTVYANTAGFNNTSNYIVIGSANSIFTANDKIYYSVPSGNTAIAGLTGNTFYYVKTSNTTGITLSSNAGGTTIDITDNRTTNPAEQHTIIPLIANTSISGTLEYRDTVRNVLYVANSTGNFVTNTFIQFHRFPTTAAITSPGPNNATLVAYAELSNIYNPTLNALVPGFSFITPTGTALGFTYRGSSNNYTLEQFENIVSIGTETSFVDQERIVASKTNEVNYNAGDKTMKMHVKLATDSDFTSPAIDVIKNNQQLITNNVDPLEFNYEEFYTYGASKSKYISKVVTLEFNEVDATVYDDVVANEAE